MTIKIEEAGRRARVQAAVAFALWCVGISAGCVVDDRVDGPTDPPPASAEPTGFGTPACVPYTCEYLDAECGRPGDGCGGEPLECGTCPDGSACEYSLDPLRSRCVPTFAARSTEPTSPVVDPATWCPAHGVECGPATLPAGHEVDCGACAVGLECGNWPGRCCGPRPEEDILCADVSPLPRLYRWCYGQPEPGCVQQFDLIRGTTLGAWCCP